MKALPGNLRVDCREKFQCKYAGVLCEGRTDVLGRVCREQLRWQGVYARSERPSNGHKALEYTNGDWHFGEKRKSRRFKAASAE